MKTLADELFKMGFSGRATKLLCDMIQVARLSDGRPVEDELFDWIPPVRAVPQIPMPDDLETEQIEIIIQSLTNIGMTNSEISMFVRHVRSVLVFSYQIRRLIKKPAPVLH